MSAVQWCRQPYYWWFPYGALLEILLVFRRVRELRARWRLRVHDIRKSSFVDIRSAYLMTWSCVGLLLSYRLESGWRSFAMKIEESDAGLRRCFFVGLACLLMFSSVLSSVSFAAHAHLILVLPFTIMTLSTKYFTRVFFLFPLGNFSYVYIYLQ